jgi:hypothetical protein
MSLLRITDVAKIAFRRCLQNKDLKCISCMYHKNAVLKGTFNKKSVRGHEDIQKYFKKLFRSAEDVKFEKDPIVFSKSGIIFESGNYVFYKKNGKMVEANYNLVLSKTKGGIYKILSHFSAIR